MKEGDRSSTFRDLASILLWSLFTLLGMLTYCFEIRQYILSNFGMYFVGMLDGIVIIMIVLSTIFYLISKGYSLKSSR